MLRYALLRQSFLFMNAGAVVLMHTSGHSKTLFRICWTSIDPYVCECRIDDRFLSLMLSEFSSNCRIGIDLTIWYAIIIISCFKVYSFHRVFIVVDAVECPSSFFPRRNYRRESLERGRRFSGLRGELPELKPFGFEGSGRYGDPTAPRGNDLVFSSQAQFHNCRWQRILWIRGYQGLR